MQTNTQMVMAQLASRIVAQVGSPSLRAVMLVVASGSMLGLAQFAVAQTAIDVPTTEQPAPGSLPASTPITPSTPPNVGDTVALAAPVAAPSLGFTPIAAPTGMTALTPYYAFVSSSMPLRSGPAERFYSIATLQQGTVVIVDAQSQGWSRVTYPAGLSAFVRAEDANVVGSSVTLANPSRLRASSQVHGFGGSWQVLLDSELASGTTLALVEPVKEGSMTVAYRVQPPATARAYVFNTALRRATDAEIAAARTKDASLPEATALANMTLGTPADAATTVATGGTAIDVPANAIGKDREQGTGPETIIQGGNQADRGNMQQSSGTDAGGATSPRQTADTIVPEVQVARDTTAEDLEPLFIKVKDQPVLEGEIDELIAEYERVQSNFDANTTERRRKAVAQRIEFLRVRADLRDALRRQQDDLAKLDSTKVQMQSQLDEWARTRYYTMVGVLQPSTVYDGGKMPVMYRVVSVGTSGSRTLGYIRKTAEMDLDQYLGQVVGVIGERSIDRSLQLNLINAIRVDPLRSADAAAPAATTTATPDGEPTPSEK